MSVNYPCNEIQCPLNHPLPRSCQHPPHLQQQRRVGSRCAKVRCHLRSSPLLQLHSGNTQNTPHKTASTIVASLERPARHTTDTLATPATTSIFACNLLRLINRPQDRKAAQGNPRKRRSSRGVSQSARPHGKDVQAMGWWVLGGWGLRGLDSRFFLASRTRLLAVVCVHAGLGGCQASCVREAMLTTPRIGKLRKPAFEGVCQTKCRLQGKRDEIIRCIRPRRADLDEYGFCVRH